MNMKKMWIFQKILWGEGKRNVIIFIKWPGECFVVKVLENLSVEVCAIILKFTTFVEYDADAENK